MSDDEREPELDLDALDLGAVEPREFARIVKRTPPRKAAEVMTGPHRRRVLDELFRRMELLFRPEAAGDRTALVRWRITGEGDACDVYETYIADGCLVVTPHTTDREPRLTVTLAAPDLLRLASGNASGPVLFLLRKLRAHGDLRLAARLTELFDMPKA
ncbi:SCP2 sterol-binding domain-containing protein [Streptomyces sp. RB6PN25]|uniref:SCP2 sterol-binding domain-containing protein n=1 Tax=Streptomyces humicola TaxID=2953240 RepID=A0ABT1Q436_9ACTN|nr:SCP2 sterol-binding domain-containing protein [Streptomyces humicola]MCQ4084639.1 SCP2 sterol-binding domain-containing protein [Streptomyces humicola]